MILELMLLLASYSREAFGGWIDADHDCQDTRAELLIARSLVPVSFTDARHCNVSSGLWIDAYTFQLERSAANLEVDHIVPLEQAWVSGAEAWTTAQRKAFANDPSELNLTVMHLNRSKGKKTPVDWTPELLAARCKYLADYASVKLQYHLNVTDVEHAVLESCR